MSGPFTVWIAKRPLFTQRDAKDCMKGWVDIEMPCRRNSDLVAAWDIDKKGGHINNKYLFWNNLDGLLKPKEYLMS